MCTIHIDTIAAVLWATERWQNSSVAGIIFSALPLPTNQNEMSAGWLNETHLVFFSYHRISRLS